MSQRDNVASRQPLPRSVRVLGAASLLNDIASEMIYPLMPQFLIGVLGGNRFYLGIVEGVAESVASLLKLWSGAWSDRVGQRKRFVLIGYALAAFARPLIGIATAPWHLFAARTADRIGKGIRTSPRDALIADATAPGIRGRAFGFHRGMDHLGAAGGPLLASALLLVWPGHLRLVFLVTLVPGVLAILLLFWGVQESTPPGGDHKSIKLTLKPFRLNFQLYLVALLIFTLGNSSDAFLLVRARELGVSTTLLPLLWCGFHIVKSVGNLLAGRAADRLGPRPLIFAGWTIYAGIYVAFALATSAWQIWTFFLVYGLFYALTEPSEKSLVTLLVGPERKGLAFGWYNFAIGIAALPSSIIFGWIYERFGPMAAFGWGAGLAALAALILLGVRPMSASGGTPPRRPSGA